MLDFLACEKLVASARDGRSKPYANNTRIEKRGDDAFALRLHATDIATFHRDGRITISTGGWRTVTTKERLGHVTRHLSTERGTWFIDCEPNPKDPEPIRGSRSVPKPFFAADPGAEPQKPAEGCIAGWDEHYEAQADHAIYRWNEREVPPGAFRFNLYYADGSGPQPSWRGATNEILAWSDQQHKPYFGDDAKRVGQHRECPHCKAHRLLHERWHTAMFGARWGMPKFGFSQMTEQLERYGSREAWQDAYIADFRAAREAKTAHRAWLDRNRVTFEDGMEITAEGYAKRPDLKQVAREQRKLKAIERKKARINKFVQGMVDALEAGLPMPSGGDCWGCCFRAEDRSVEPMGVDHLDEHIRERYYVPSMFVNALREVGYKDAGIYMWLDMNPEANTMGGRGRAVSPTVTRALRSYLYNRLVPEIATKKIGV